MTGQVTDPLSVWLLVSNRVVCITVKPAIERIRLMVFCIFFTSIPYCTCMSILTAALVGVFPHHHDHILSR